MMCNKQSLFAFFKDQDKKLLVEDKGNAERRSSFPLMILPHWNLQRSARRCKLNERVYCILIY